MVFAARYAMKRDRNAKMEAILSNVLQLLARRQSATLEFRASTITVEDAMPSTSTLPAIKRALRMKSLALP
jgi:hypothetical protein